jgi:Adipocyte plasma membrane-associated protein-like, N-terminal
VFSFFKKICALKINSMHVSSVAKPRALEGVLAMNDYLENPKKLYEGKLIAPEHILERDGVIYTSLANGDVVKIVKGEIEVMTKFGKYCCE